MKAYVLIFTGLCFFAGQNSADSVPSSTPSTQPKAVSESSSIEEVTREPKYPTSEYGIMSNCGTVNLALPPLPNDTLYTEPYYEISEMNELPWLVFIQVRRNILSICGGNIIAKYWILAPAHCVCHRSSNNTFVWNPIYNHVTAGSNDYKTPKYTYGIDNVICHPHYGPPPVEDANWKYDNNIALIKLKEDVAWGSDLKAIPIDASPRQTLAKSTALIRVWGSKCLLGDTSLRRTKREIMSTKDSEENWKKHYSIPLRGNVLSLKKKSPCKGLYECGATVQDVLVGIPSDRHTWCATNIVRFTSVSYHRHWIKHYVKNVEFKEIKPQA